MTTREQLLKQKQNSDNARARYQKSKKNILNYSNESFALNVKNLELYKNIKEYEKIKAQRDTLHNAKEKEYHQTDGPTLSNSHINDLLTNMSYGKNGTETFVTQINKWKVVAKESLIEGFKEVRKKDLGDQELVDELYRQIGQLKVELEWLKKKSARFSE